MTPKNIESLLPVTAASSSASLGVPTQWGKSPTGINSKGPVALEAETPPLPGPFGGPCATEAAAQKGATTLLVEVINTKGKFTLRRLCLGPGGLSGTSFTGPCPTVNWS